MEAKVETTAIELKAEMDSYVLTHTISLQDTLNSLRQEMKTELFLDPIIEQERIKHELTDELELYDEETLKEIKTYLYNDLNLEL